ncbi:hypothetical protein ECO319P1_00029 [Escherichia phage ECO319P1]|nr:hypothetical protein ECO319P1_00029 [Escherichia phage ECO319P1]
MKLSKFNIFKLCFVAVLAALMAAFFYFRGIDFKDCLMAKYDLQRETTFRILTGACTTKGKDGSLIYVKQLRGFGDDVVDDHQ